MTKLPSPKTSMTLPITERFASLTTCACFLALMISAVSGLAQDQGAPPSAAIAISSSNGLAAAEAPSAPPAQTDLIQKLLSRIEQLEKKEADRASAGEAVQKAYAERVEKLLGRIGELETKVGSLEAGRVLPEITLPANDAPTTADLDQKIRILERQNELASEAAAARAKEAPRLSIGQNGVSFSSADSNFVFSLRGVLQADNRSFFNDGGISGNDTFLLRRARPIFQGTVFRDFDFLFVPDFAGSSVQIFDTYLNYRYAPWLQLRAGKFRPPVGLEQLQLDANTAFNERSLVTALVPNRDIGFQLWGDIANGALSYAAGVFNGVGDGRNTSNADFEDHREVAARLFARPFKNSEAVALRGLGFGVGGSFGQTTTNLAGMPANIGGVLPGYATDGQQQFFSYNPTGGALVLADGDHWRISPQAYYYYGPFGLLGEYVISDQRVQRFGALPLVTAELQHTAWQIQGSWVLTGEDAGYDGVTPRRPFDPRNGNWGAFQLVARYSELNIDDAAFPYFSDPLTSATSAHAWSVGLNWYLNRNIRFNASYSHTTFEGGGGPSLIAPGTVTRQPEQVLFTRLQLGF